MTSVMALASIPLPTLHPPATSAAKPGKAQSAQNALLDGNSTARTSALLSQISAKLTKAISAPAASMATYWSTALARFLLSTRSSLPTQDARHGIGMPKNVLSAHLSGTSLMVFVLLSAIYAKPTITPLDSASLASKATL